MAVQGVAASMRGSSGRSGSDCGTPPERKRRSCPFRADRGVPPVVRCCVRRFIIKTYLHMFALKGRIDPRRTLSVGATGVVLSVSKQQEPAAANQRCCSVRLCRACLVEARHRCVLVGGSSRRLDHDRKARDHLCINTDIILTDTIQPICQRASPLHGQ